MDQTTDIRPPNDGPVAATLRRAEELLDADEPQRAVDLLEEAAAQHAWQGQDPETSVWLTIALAHARLRQDRPGNARAAVALARQRLPVPSEDTGPSRLAAAVALCAAGIELSVGDLPSADAHLRAVADGGGAGSGEAWLGLARVAVRRGAWLDAERALAAASARGAARLPGDAPGRALQPALSAELVRAHAAIRQGHLERAEALIVSSGVASSADAALVRARLHRARWVERREARELLLTVRAVEVALGQVRGRTRPMALREALLHRAVARALAGDGAFASADARTAMGDLLASGGPPPPAPPEWPAAWLFADAAFALGAGGDPLHEAAVRTRDALLRPEDEAPIAAFGAASREAKGAHGSVAALRDVGGAGVGTSGASARGEGDALVRLAFERGYHEAVRAFRREIVTAALRETGGHRTKAADLLGLQRTHLARLVRELDVDAPSRDGRSRPPKTGRDDEEEAG